MPQLNRLVIQLVLLEYLLILLPGSIEKSGPDIILFFKPFSSLVKPASVAALIGLSQAQQQFYIVLSHS